MQSNYERILGTLTGCAIGDAMGMPGEMWSQQRIRRTFGEITDFLPGHADNEISAGFAPGETTDDSIVTVLVAKALIRSGGELAPMDLVTSIQNWAASNPKSKTVIGPSTQRAFQQIANGVAPELAGKNGETNGASMRISPVGIISTTRDLESLVRRVANVCMPTHNTSSAIAAACAVAAAVAHGIDGEDDIPLRDVILDAAVLGEKQGFETCSPSVAERIRFSLELSDSIADDEEFMRRQYALVGCGLPSTESVPTALTIALRCGTDLMRCARMCANIGGDTDTMGAIACAISGAHGGLQTVPQETLDRLLSVNDFDLQGLTKQLSTLREQMLS